MIVSLKDVVKDANTGADAIQRAPIVDYNTGKKCLRIGDISNAREYNEWGYTEVNEENYKKYKLEKEDILIARTGSTIGINKFIDKDYNAVYNNGLIRLRINKEKYNSRYIYYVIQTKTFKDYITGIAFGTTGQPNMKIEDLLNFKFEYIPLEQQNKIAHILSNIDKKIELNNQINDNLYETQKCYFQKLFKDNDNYETVKLDELCNISAGGDAPKEKSNIKSKKYNIPIISNGTDNDGVYGYTDNAKITTKSVTISARGTVGFKVLRNYNYYSIVRLISIFPKTDRISSEYLFYILDEIVINGTGTTQQQLTVPMVKNLKIKIFKKELIDKFTAFAVNLNNMIDKNKNENQSLEQLRDTLLPKLMNGEIDLNRIEI